MCAAVTVPICLLMPSLSVIAGGTRVVWKLNFKNVVANCLCH